MLTPTPTPTPTHVALVTGANRGIGFEIVRQLAGQGLSVILTARDPLKGEEALSELHRSGLGSTRFIPLDVTSDESVRQAAAKVRSEFGRLDVLVNNAGIFIDATESEDGPGASSILKADLDVVRKTLETNTFGAIRMAQSFVPLMLENRYGRVVQLSSGMGQLSEMNGGWPAYRISKTALNAVTRILADELQGTGILVNSVCPGWVRTDMGGSEAERSVQEGADTAVWLATLPEGGPTGGFFRDRRPIPW